jgi:hypothetical protein
MAKSTPIVLTAGGVVVADQLVSAKSPDYGNVLMTGVAIGLAALAAAGLDAVIPGFGTGTAWLLVVYAVLTHGKSLSDKILKG